VTFLLATTNANKVREIRAVLTDMSHRFVSLADLPSVAAPEESAATFWENARQKAFAYARATGLTSIAEDSGLEIAALGGEPGVRSARFLGADVPYPVRFQEIYRRVGADTASAARFVTALCVTAPDGRILFECETAIDGALAGTPAGANGFGYDPIFWYPPLGKTTAEMSEADKTAVSHRARAFRDFARWLASLPI
jgi:XTP/dITP diphosphohydrolase